MKAVVINREDRPERLKETREQLDRFGIEFSVFPAITQPGGWRGCRLSHITVLEKYRNDDMIWIMEDDIHFLSYPREALDRAMDELPMDFDILYLGISPLRKYERYSEHLFRVNGGHTTHCMIYNNRPGGVIDFILQHKDTVMKWDLFLSNVIHPIFKCYCTFPITCTQRQTKSDTCKRSDTSTIIRNYQKYCK